MKKAILFMVCALSIAAWPLSVPAAEPNIVDYTSLPVFTVSPVKPNILILLDNSGSMNFNAYGTYPGDYGTVSDEPYAGEPFVPALEKTVAGSADDSEENKGSHWAYYNHVDLDLGRFCSGCDESIIGLRFQDLEIPPGSEITAAYIEFTAYDSIAAGDPLNLKITAQDVDDAPAFNAANNDLSDRTQTSKKVHWSPGDWVANTAYQTPDISDVVQEVVDRTGWKSGNDMVLLIEYESVSDARRTAYAYDASAANAPKLHIEYTQATNTKYYGYFNPDWFYEFDNNKFVHAYKKVGFDTATCASTWEVMAKATVDAGGSATQCLADATIATGDGTTGLWDGNWMNWATMRRIDVARKVMMGGLASSRQGGGNQVNYGETPDQSSRVFVRQFDSSTGAPVTPYSEVAATLSGGMNTYGMKGGYIYVDTDGDGSYTDNNGYKRFKLAIDKQQAYDPEDFHEDTFNPSGNSEVNLSGVLQKVGDKAWWGNEYFYYGEGNGKEGGKISNPVSEHVNDIITDLQNTPANTWTPLAESYYVAMQYFKQEEADSSLGFANGAVPVGIAHDPYYQDKEYIPCAKSFVILLTDGASTMDQNVPASLKNYDGDTSETTRSYSSSGSDYLDDVALYARTNDLRADLDGDQNLILYTIYAFGNEANARDLLRDAARNGGFVDKNGNNQPDGDYADDPDDRLEWDANGDDDPDTYFEAQSGYALEAKLLEAINDILRRAASGTAVSVLATSSEGEGNLVQAYFRPVVTNGLVETKWVGYLQSLWVDAFGNLREDTNQNQTLDLDADKILTYEIDASGNTKVNKFAVASGDEYPSTDKTENLNYTTTDMGDIEAIWEAGGELANRDPNTRKIFTLIDFDYDGDGVDELAPDLYGGWEFTVNGTNEDKIKPYLGVKDNTAWSYLGATQDERADNLIKYIRGFDPGLPDIDPATTDMRERDINGTVWKLGDIVHSTPVSIAQPPDNYGLIYSDRSYQEFLAYHKSRDDRETVVYVGANDGMLHAFTSWQYDAVAKQFVPAEDAGGVPFTDSIGDELWAYIPRALLPHLKWLADPDYGHTYYVDLKPKVTDVRIFYNTLGDPLSGDIDATYHKNGWGTVLIGGLRLGGKSIPVLGEDFDYDGAADADQTFSSSFFAIDISNPRSPEVLWEKTYDGLNFTTSEPAVVKVGEKWFAVFGSGPTDYEGNSSTNGHVFVVDLATGEPYQDGSSNDWLFETAESDAFMTPPAALDKNLNYNVDAVYLGETYAPNPTSWAGSMYKIAVPWWCTASDCSAVPYGDVTNGTYSDDPVDLTHPWLFSKMFESPTPITAPPSLSVDWYGNAWVYFGSGRYFNNEDKSDTDTQYLFGVKDPFFNPKHDGSGTYSDGYYLCYENCAGAGLDSLTLDSTTSNPYGVPDATNDLPDSYLFDADSYKIVYPWGCEAMPVGDCSSVDTGSIGDVNGDGSCTCSYDWPTYVCTSTDPATTDAAACGGVVGITLEGTYYVSDTLGLFNGGLCQCLPYQEPQWGCEETVSGSGACDAIAEGQVGDVNGDGSCTCFYWDAVGETDQSCLNVNFGDATGTYVGPDGTDCTVTKLTSVPFNWSCAARPAGDCTGVTVGSVGDVSAAGDGSAIGAYWDCNPTDPINDPGGCDTLDYTQTDSTYYEDFLVTSGGSCSCAAASDPADFVVNTTTNATSGFDDLVLEARKYDGWIRTLVDPGERALSKPALLGGISLFTSYVPSAEACAFGGYSYLYALYFESGTAYKLPVIGTEIVDGVETVSHRIELGLGLASSVGIHVGQQEGNEATGFIQQSTGAISEITLDPAFTIRSGLRSWQEKNP